MNDKYGFGLNINEEAEKRWKEVVSTDFDYDGDYLIRIITHKLNLMSDYFEDALCEDALCQKADKIVTELKEIKQLGEKILTFNYGEEADIIFDQYGDETWLVCSSEDTNYVLWDSLNKKAIDDREKDIETFFRKIGKKVNNWWL